VSDLFGDWELDGEIKVYLDLGTEKGEYDLVDLGCSHFLIREISRRGFNYFFFLTRQLE